MTGTLARTEAILADLIAFPTVSTDSNLEMMAYMANLLGDLGARVDLFASDCGTKSNMFATLGPEEDGGLVLSGHSDVVPVTDQNWSSDPFTLRDEGDKLYGRGTCDMKGFIASCLAKAPDFAALPLIRPLHFCFTHDEEVGCLGARALVPELKRRGYSPATAIIGEPTEMKVIEGHKGCCEYVTHFDGLEGHGSAPDRGVNAVAAAVRYAAKLLELAEDLKARAPSHSRFDPPWTTVNIGLLHGGSALNVIPNKAELGWEMRPVQNGDMQFVKSRLEAYVRDTLLPEMRHVCEDARIWTDVIGEVVGLEPMDANAARDLTMRLTGCNEPTLVPFGTEAGLFQQLGMEVVVCGPGSIAQAHMADEYISRAQLAAGLTMLDGIGQHCTR